MRLEKVRCRLSTNSTVVLVGASLRRWRRVLGRAALSCEAAGRPDSSSTCEMEKKLISCGWSFSSSSKSSLLRSSMMRPFPSVTTARISTSSVLTLNVRSRASSFGFVCQTASLPDMSLMQYNDREACKPAVHRSFLLSLDPTLQRWSLPGSYAVDFADDT